MQVPTEVGHDEVTNIIFAPHPTKIPDRTFLYKETNCAILRKIGQVV